MDHRSPPLTERRFETLLYAVEDGVATITLNRPEKMNAFTTRMHDDLIAAFDSTDADADDAVRAQRIDSRADARPTCEGVGAFLETRPAAFPDRVSAGWPA